MRRLIFVFVIFASYVLPASAETTDNSVLDFAYADGAIGSIIKFATGPIAQMIGILAIMTAAYFFVRWGDKGGPGQQGDAEYPIGLKALMISGIVIGLLMGLNNMFPSMAGACI